MTEDEYRYQETLSDLCDKLTAAEQEISCGAEGKDFETVAYKLREYVTGKPEIEQW